MIELGDLLKAFTNLFSNRELATAIWVIGGLVYLGFRNNAWSQLLNLIRAILAVKLVQVYLLMTGYLTLQMMFLHQAGLWDASMIVPTLYWLPAALFSLRDYVSDDLDGSNYFRRQLFGLVTHTAILEYIVGFQSFSFLVEIIVTPILILATILAVFAEGKTQHKAVQNLAISIVAVYMLFAFSYSLWHLITDWSLSAFWGFVFSIIMSLMFAPFLAAMRIYTAYADVFYRLSMPFGKSDVPMPYTLFKALMFFGWNIKLLRRWCNHVQRQAIVSKSDVDRTISHFSNILKIEKTASKENETMEWRPHKLKNCLESYNLITNHYENYYEDEWSASAVTEIDNSIQPNNLAFYLTGNLTTVTEVKLKLNCNNPEQQVAAIKYLYLAANELYNNVIGEDLPSTVKDAIINKKSTNLKYKDFACRTVCEYWTHSHIKGGFDIQFVIERIDLSAD